MRIVYQITNQDHGTVYETRTFKRRDAAANHLVRMVRDAIRSNAGLDTAWGVRAYREAEEYARFIVVPGPNLPHARLISVRGTHGVMLQVVRV